MLNTLFMLASHSPKLIPNGYMNVPLAAPSGIFWHAKDFAMSPEVDPDAGGRQLGSYNGLRCTQESSDVFMMFYDVLMITSELWESVKPA